VARTDLVRHNDRGGQGTVELLWDLWIGKRIHTWKTITFLWTKTAPNNIAKTNLLSNFVKYACLCGRRTLMKPEETADAIVFLAFEKASLITGQIVDVNGGKTAA
jgi:NAD(P)-dependent dehydrogenase (short-subunit alcohol dehydrogenase family)